MEVSPIGLVNDVSPSKHPATVQDTHYKVPKHIFVFPPDISLQFVPGHYQVPGVLDLIPMNSGLDGDKRPMMQDGLLAVKGASEEDGGEPKH